MVANPPYTTKELSPQTWPDFERLFSQGGGWDFCGCMLFQRGGHLSAREFRTRAEQRVRNLQEKRALVEQGHAHGILVYADAEPIGWCQFGPVGELPLPGRGRPSSRVLAQDPTSEWRITCFVTHTRHRRKGVASVALGAAIEAIRRRGGGWVEGCPIALAAPFGDRRLRELLRRHGRDSAEVAAYLEARGWPEVEVRGVGPVRAVRGHFGNVSHAGTVALFERHGFEAVRVVGDTHVLMRLRVRRRERGAGSVPGAGATTASRATTDDEGAPP